MDSEKILQALIIGCGRIAGGHLEYDGPTHADAYKRHAGFTISACVDANVTQRNNFMRRWDVPRAYETVTESFSGGQTYDIASVCVPTNAHASILEELLDASVKIIFCEKPITDNIQDAKRLVAEFNKRSKLIAVAYLRRWHPRIRALKNEIDIGRWGKINSMVGYYTKGICHNGSHLIDLAQLLNGPLHLDVVTGKRIDYCLEDPTVDAVMRFNNNVPLHIIGCDGQDHDLFELHLLFSEGMISIEQSGWVIRRRGHIEDPYHKGYKKLSLGELTNPDHGDPFYHAISNIKNVIDIDEDLLSDGENSIGVQQLCVEMLNRSKSVSLM